MKARGVRMHGVKDVRLEEFTLPEIKEDEILLKIICDSICMSTWKAIQQGENHLHVPDNISEHPVVVGHEFSGIILKAGSKWEKEYPVGKQIIIQPGEPGVEWFPGYGLEFCGGAMDYAVVPNEILEHHCMRVYEGNSFFEASLSEPIVCIIGGYNTSYHIKPGTHDHIIGAKKGGNLIIMGGCGPMGLGAISYALAMKNRPAMVVVTEVNEDRLQRAKRFITPEEAAEKGIALHYVNTAKMENEVQELLDLTGGKGYDDVLLYAPVRHIADVGNQILAKDGCMSLFAGPTDKKFGTEINLYDCHYRDTKIVGSSGGCFSDFEETIALMSAGEVKPQIMVTHIGGLDAYADTVSRVPEIPGGKKLIYTQIDLPLTAIDDFAELGKKDPLFAKLAEACEKNRGLWNKEAEDILLKHFEVL